MKKLIVDTKVLGWVNTNTYIVYNKNTFDCIIIDPAADESTIIKHVEHKGLKPVAIFLTHGHFDHILAVDKLREKYNIKVYVSELEKNLIVDTDQNCGKMFMRRDISVNADIFLKDKEILHFLDVKWEFIHTPGHTLGSGCFLIREENIIFTGDTLFANSYGRCDFPSGSMDDIYKSIKYKLFVLEDDIIVYPGHGRITDILVEKQNNPINGYKVNI